MQTFSTNTVAWYKSFRIGFKLENVIGWVRRIIQRNFKIRNPDLPYYITIGVASLLFIFALNGFIELTEGLAEKELGPFDRRVTEFIASFRGDGLTGFFAVITKFGERIPFMLISVLLAGMLYAKYHSIKLILQTVAVLLLASLSNIALKRVISRTRPEVEHLVAVDSMSYPSGHSMSAMAFYGFLIYLCLKLDMPGWARWGLVSILCLIIAGVGISRIYLGVHYPSDVAAGFIGGLIWVSFCIVLFNLVGLLRRRGKKEPQSGLASRM